MKILIPLISFGKGGGFRVLSELANHWIKMGHSVEFLVYQSSSEPNFPTDAKIFWYNNKGLIFEENCLNLKKHKLRLIGVLFSLRKAINKSDYDLVLATQCFTAFPTAFSKKCEKKFYYIQAYEPEYYPGRNLQSYILRNLSRLTYKLRLERIVNSPLYFNYEEIKSSKYVYPGLDFTKFYPRIKNNSDKFIIGSIGRIEPYKGTSYVLDAFNELRSVYKNIELHIAFGDIELDKIEGIKVINIKNDIELAEYYNNVNVIVAVGTYQLGAVHYPVIESMACKTPVITTGYLPADNSNSWLVPIKDSNAIKNAILDIMGSPDYLKQRIENGFMQVQEFNWEIVSKKMIKYFSFVDK